MNPRRDPIIWSFLTLAALFTCAALPGCSNSPLGLAAPAHMAIQSAAAATDAPPVLTSPPSVDHWKSPRIRVWTDDGFRQVQNQGGVFPGRFYDFERADRAAVTFHWSAGSMAPHGQIVGYRWALDLPDLLDETPRSGPSDLAHWSSWDPAETSATVGPFVSSPATHDFTLEARDNLGLVSLFIVRIRTGPASAEEPAEIPLAPR